MLVKRTPGLKAAQAYLDERGWVDMEIYSYAHPGMLVVAMNKDLTYAHESSLVFHDPSFFSGPTSWTSSSEGGRSLRVLEKDERLSLDIRAARMAEGRLFSIDTDDGFSVLIGARDIELDTGTVFYYPRENLGPGESLAYWLS